jgi:ribonuclease P protein component
MASDHGPPPLLAVKLSVGDAVSAVPGSAYNFPVVPRRKRLSRAAFPNVLTKGRRISSLHFVAAISKEANGYGVVVPKKIARLSVTRHRIKRRVFEALRTLTLPSSTAIILFPKAPVASMTFAEVFEELQALLSKIQ